MDWVRHWVDAFPLLGHGLLVLQTTCSLGQGARDMGAVYCSHCAPLVLVLRQPGIHIWTHIPRRSRVLDHGHLSSSWVCSVPCLEQQVSAGGTSSRAVCHVLWSGRGNGSPAHDVRTSEKAQGPKVAGLSASKRGSSSKVSILDYVRHGCTIDSHSYHVPHLQKVPPQLRYPRD